MYRISIEDFFSAQRWILDQYPSIANKLNSILVEINQCLEELSLEEVIYPPIESVLNSFTYFPINKTKILIVGQDPYHGEGQANGLAFAVRQGIRKPPSLKNIEKELQRSFNTSTPLNSNLVGWAKQEVLLINRVLTVSSGRAGSHRNIGWERFTETIIDLVSRSSNHTVFILWGNDAMNLSGLVSSKHTILKAAHPSPLSAYRGFFGCDHFLLANEALQSHAQFPVDWFLDIS